MTIRCEIVSQDRTVFTGDVDIVVLPGAGGEMGILPKHAPVLTTLKYGFVRVRKSGKEEVFAVSGGVAEVQ
ncbi:MAG: ATP synthase F1 subunit epsilon, partial [Anaerolineae bacterium]|nr:ATP synthase F1 subunit epsilon [Anaerolineae bacterium]